MGANIYDLRTAAFVADLFSDPLVISITARDNIYSPRCVVTLSVAFNSERPLPDADIGNVAPTFNVIPESITVSRTHTRAPDSFSMELDYLDLPIDPRTVDSILVVVYLADGDDAVQRESYENVAFMGYVDSPEISFSDAGKKVSLSGRDYTGIFLDFRWSPSIPLNMSLLQIIDSIVKSIPGTESLAIRTAEEVDLSVNVAAVYGKTLFTPEDDTDAWTLITDICGILALTPMIYLDALVIVSAKSVTQYVANVGRFLSSLSIKKDYNDAKKRQIEVKCWDASARETRTALYPVSPPLAKKVVSSDGTVKETPVPRVPFFTQGSYNQVQLLQMAERIYKDAVRTEIKGEFTTSELLDDHHFPIMQYLGNGDKIVLRRHQLDVSFDDYGIYDDELNGRALSLMQRNAVSLEDAHFILEARDRASEMSFEFYVQEAEHTWNNKTGYSLNCKFINYVGESFQGVTE